MVIGGKRKLKGSDIWIDDDLTWEERRNRWLLRERGEKKERGRGYG